MIIDLPLDTPAVVGAQLVQLRVCVRNAHPDEPWIPYASWAEFDRTVIGSAFFAQQEAAQARATALRLNAENATLREQVAALIADLARPAAPPALPTWSQPLAPTPPDEPPAADDTPPVLPAAVVVYDGKILPWGAVDEADLAERGPEPDSNPDHALPVEPEPEAAPTVVSLGGGGGWQCSCGYTGTQAWTRRHLKAKHGLGAAAINALVPRQPRVRPGRPTHDADADAPAVPEPASAPPAPSACGATCADCGTSLAVFAESTSLPGVCIRCAPAHRNGHAALVAA
jgi:hypothetical protein